MKEERKEAMSESSVSVHKVPEFSGEDAEFPVWWSQFQALGVLKGFSDALEPNFESTLPASYNAVLDVTDLNQKAQKDALKMNNVAMSYFTMALSSDELLCTIEECKTVNFPGGIACELVKSLLDEFKPNDTIGAAQQLKELMSLKLGKNENPKKLGGRMAKILNAYRSPIAEGQKVAVIVAAGGRQYAGVIRQEGKNIQAAKSRDATAKEYIKAMAEEWRLSGGSDEVEEHTDAYKKEVRLAVVGEFQGKCYGCGETGHRRNQCPKSGTGGFQGDCGKCGKKGHKADDCWDDEKNASKRPKWFVRKNGTEAEASGTCVEMML